jgi:hypothetical protein
VFWGEIAPMSMVRSHLRMMPVLMAEEALHHIDEHLVGAGRLKHHAAIGYMRRLERQARRVRRRPARRTPEPSDIQTLNAIGIKTVM